MPLDAASEYNALKEQHPDALVGFEQGGQFEFYGEDARKICELVGGKLLEKETELGTVPVTGFPSDQWAHRAKQLWQCGENIYLAGLNEDGTHHQTKYLRRKDYLPLGATIHMEGRAFRVDNSTALDGTRKFKNFWLSTFAVQRLSDLICLEHQLSTIEYKPYRERQKRIVYPPRESNRDRLCGIIDTILAEQPKDFEVFLQKLIQQGYEVKRGKHTAVKGKGQNLPFGKNGKFLFQLGYTPVVSDMKKIVQKTAALSFPKWALAIWDMDTATLYMVKYDRSH